MSMTEHGVNPSAEAELDADMSAALNSLHGALQQHTRKRPFKRRGYARPAKYGGGSTRKQKKPWFYNPADRD